MNITNRTTHDVQQGTGPWLRLRAGFLTASEAPAMMGVSKYATRTQLLHQKHTGVALEPDAATLGKFAAGHAAEAEARPHAEMIAGGDLYPVTMTVEADGLALLASLDGLTLDEATCWETKLWNEELAAAVRAGADALPEHYTVQMDQELLVSGAQRCLFTCTDGTPERLVSCWYESTPEKAQALVDGWRQFLADLEAYEPQKRAEPVTAAPMESLPAVAVRMDGALQVHSNLPAFGAALRAFVERIPKQPSTDQEFADTEAACKALKRAEEALDAAEANALAELSDVETMRRLVADFRALARDTRLERSRMVERRKQELREQAVAKARSALDLHIEVVNAEIAPMRLQPVPADFAGAIKGLKSLDSMHAKLDAALAAAKIDADTQGRAIRKNLEHFKEAAAGLEALFADLHQLVHKSPEDFRAAVQARVLAQQERDRKAEEARKAAEAQRIAEAEQRAREQEAARIAAEQAAAAEAQRRQEAAAAAAQRQAAAALDAAQRQETTAPAVASAAQPRQEPAPVPRIAAPAPAPRADEPATLKLGDIGERLGFALRADFITGTLHVTPAAVERALPRFSESQFGLICRQLVAHVSAMAEVHAAEEVA